METRDGATYFAGRVWGAALRCGHDAANHPLVGRSAPDLTLSDGRRLNEALRDGRALLVDLDPATPLHPIAWGHGDRPSYVSAIATVDADFDSLLVRPDGVVA